MVDGSQLLIPGEELYQLRDADDVSTRFTETVATSLFYVLDRETHAPVTLLSSFYTSFETVPDNVDNPITSWDHYLLYSLES